MRQPYLFVAVIFGVLVRFVACGSSNTHRLTDGGADSPRKIIDAPLIDAPPAPVTVIVTLDGSAASGVPVYFQDADSSVVSDTVTGSDGTASAVMAPGGFVTVVTPQDPDDVTPAIGGGGLPTPTQVLQTFAGVKPGDVLHSDTGAGESATSVTFSVVVPTDPNDAVAHYELETTCGILDIDPEPTVVRARPATANNPPVQVTFDNCTGSADVLVVSTTNGGQPVDSIFVPDQTFGTGQTLTITGPYTAVGSSAWSITDVPAAVEDVSLEEFLVTSRGLLFDSDQVDGGGSAVALAVGLPVVSGSTEMTLMEFDRSGSVLDNQEVVVWGPPAATNAFDYGSNRLHDFVTDPQVDPVDQQIGWAIETAGVQPDTVTATFQVERETQTEDTNWEWDIAAPGNEDGQITLPTVPTDVFAFNPQVGDSTNVIEISGIQLPGGYDAIRGEIFNFEPIVEQGQPNANANSGSNGQLLFQLLEFDDSPASRRSRRHTAHVTHPRHR